MKVDVRCECGHFFAADEAAAGGYVNCPRCGAATLVPGLRDPLWRLLQVGAAIVVGGLVWIVGASYGAPAAVLAALVSVALFWLVSRAF